MTTKRPTLAEIEKAVGFDPAALCVFCEQPVGALSMGGPRVCPTCDCGCNRDGTPWSLEDFDRMQINLRKNLKLPPYRSGSYH
jgi:hypothetical protein